MNYKRAFVTVAVFAVASPVSAQNAQAVFTKVSPSVVVVKGKTAQGSGVAVSVRAEGTGKQTAIVTNCHVVEGNVVVRITHQSDTTVAYVRSCDTERDIAIVELRGELPVASTRSAASLKIGEPVYAIGAPRGLDLSISEGIVSQLRGTEVATQAMPLIQTTAAISPGSSGGGLFDAQGRLVGITTLYLKDAQSLNFAIPSDWIAEAPLRGTVGKGFETESRSTLPQEKFKAPTGPVETCGWKKHAEAELFTAYLDRCTIKKQGKYHVVWELKDRVFKAMDISNGLYASSKHRIAVDCEQDRSALIGWVTYARAMGAGGVVNSATIAERDWHFEDEAPGSVGASLVREVCR